MDEVPELEVGSFILPGFLTLTLLPEDAAEPGRGAPIRRGRIYCWTLWDQLEDITVAATARPSRISERRSLLIPILMGYTLDSLTTKGFF